MSALTAGGSGGGGGGGSGGSGQVTDIVITSGLDEILKRITDIKNIAGVVVVNSEGVTVKSTLDNSLTALVNTVFHLWNPLSLARFSVLRIGIIISKAGQVHSPRFGSDQRIDVPPHKEPQTRSVGGSRSGLHAYRRAKSPGSSTAVITVLK